MCNLRHLKTSVKADIHITRYNKFCVNVGLEYQPTHFFFFRCYKSVYGFWPVDFSEVWLGENHWFFVPVRLSAPASTVDLCLTEIQSK